MILTYDGMEGRASQLYRESRQRVFERTDKLFARLAVGQFVAGLVAAIWLTPLTYLGAKHELHVHVVLALVMGFLTAAPVIYLARYYAGKPYTRYAIASCQMLTSALLIHLSGGRIETHFHIFGSLAFLTFYRDWRVFVPATIVVTLDHLIRGIYFPESVFGVLVAGDWRWAEHAAWVVFCDFFLVKSVRQQAREMWETSLRQAALENAAAIVEKKVEVRTAELQLEREKFENAFLAAPVGMALVDASTLGVRRANNEFARILQGEAGALVGLSLKEFCEHDGGAAVLQRILAREPRVEAEIDCPGLQGSTSRVLFGCSLLKGSDSYVVQLLDISKRVQAEKRLREQSEMMLRSQKLESLGVLTGGIAHELNSPIQFIGSNLKFLRESFADIQDFLEPILKDDELSIEEVRGQAKELELEELLEDMQCAAEESGEGVGRITAIVKSMRDYSHPGGREEEVQLNDVLVTTTTVARNEIKYVADVSMDLQPDLATVWGNRGELMQVFLNIVVNAVHAIQEKVGDSGSRGAITIITRNVDRGVEVRVGDSGVGMPEEVKNRIFDPFFTTKPVGKGTGQGLAITHNIVSNHDAQLSVESEPGVGTSMILTFPIASVCEHNVERKAS